MRRTNRQLLPAIAGDGTRAVETPDYHAWTSHCRVVRMNKALLRGYVAAMACVIAAFLFLPAHSMIRAPWQTGVGWLAAAAMVAATRRNPSMPRAAWCFCTAGIFLNATGISVDFVCSHFLGYAESEPALPADAFWLMLYPGLVTGLSLFAHRRSAAQDWSTIVDAAIVVVGMSLLAWVFVVDASLHRSTMHLVGFFVVVAYPIGDLAVLGVLVRLLLQQGGQRNIALRLIAVALALFLCGDLAWLVVSRFDLVLAPALHNVLDAAFLVAFACFGAAAVHPDAGEFTRPRPGQERGVSPRLLFILATTSLIPSLLLIHQAWRGAVTNGIAIGLSSAMLFLLVMVRVIGLLRKVEVQARQLGAISRTDELTGLLNRRAWMHELGNALEGCKRWNLPLSAALIDLDHFKAFNDAHGHQAGDKLLREASSAWREATRSPDMLGRYGGEEFILIMPNTDVPGALPLLERFRPLMPSRQTFSAGLALWDGQEGLEELLRRADAALYRAKALGRNRTVVAETAATRACSDP
jgi:diguanylate cyclase (GGDEF)-like protein